MNVDSEEMEDGVGDDDDDDDDVVVNDRVLREPLEDDDIDDLTETAQD